MNDIDYTKYSITSTSQFDGGLSQLKDANLNNEVKKLFRCIDEIIEDIDMYEKEYARPLRNSNKMIHIHLDGRKTGDIILIYKVDGHDIDLDLKLYNITNHKDLDRVSNPKFTNRQLLHEFNVIENKFSQVQLDYVEECYLDLVSDYKFHKLKGESKSEYSKRFLQDYFNNTECADSLGFNEFKQILHYFEKQHNRSIEGSINLSNPVRTSPITEREENYIMTVFDDYDVDVVDAYIETEVDEYGDTYEYMYVSVASDNFREIKLLESDLYSINSLFEIEFSSKRNGLGTYGRIYEFVHYFE